jgi:cysteine desulfurase family protein
MQVTYLDNAATTWPKPEDVIEAMTAYAREIGGSPGRSGHRLSIEAGRIIHRTRNGLARIIDADDAFRIVFTRNATESLNLAIAGFLRPGDHVITSGMEHNSVMRPLRRLERSGVELSVVACSPEGLIDPDDVRRAIRPSTVMIVITHASNVTGSIMPVEAIGAIARKHGIAFCVDAAQTAGSVPISVRSMNIDLLAFTGHKSLFGPQGTGGLYIREGLEARVSPLILGGTGSRSEHEEQPDFMPDRYESGTPNTIGIAGLGAGLEFILGRGVERIREHEVRLTALFMDRLRGAPGVTVYGPHDAAARTPVVSFTIDGMTSSDASALLEERFGVMSRPGLHCAPAAHRTIGTFPRGTCRFSFALFNTEHEINDAADAVMSLARTSVESR